MAVRRALAGQLRVKSECLIPSNRMLEDALESITAWGMERGAWSMSRPLSWLIAVQSNFHLGTDCALTDLFDSIHSTHREEDGDDDADPETKKLRAGLSSECCAPPAN